jgi:hypothetical protein
MGGKRPITVRVESGRPSRRSDLIVRVGLLSSWTRGVLLITSRVDASPFVPRWGPREAP